MTPNRRFSTEPENEKTMSFSMNMVFNKNSMSNGSWVFRASDKLVHHGSTPACELFYNGRAKFHIPLTYLDSSNDLKIIEVLKDAVEAREKAQVDNGIFDEFQYIDGKDLLLGVWASLGSYFHFFKDLDKKIKEAIIVIELENIRKDVLYFDLESYRSLIRQNGLLFSDKNYYFIDNDRNPILNIIEDDVTFYLIPVALIFEAFGFSNHSCIELFLDLLNTLQKDQEKS